MNLALHRIALVALMLVAVTAAANRAPGAITPDQVLVVYNSASSEGTALRDAYLAAHPGIPAENVLDLADPALLTANLSYADFTSRVRDPIRAHLAPTAPPAPADIVAFALLRPFPHRILDTDNANVGDNPSQAGGEIQAGDATFASVDAELALLWQDLADGEAGGQMDSYADNMIDNPLHMSTVGVETYPRGNITAAKSFANAGNAAWLPAGSGPARLTAGDIYLVCRIDGATHADAQALIPRAFANRVDRRSARILLDEYDTTLDEDLDDDPLFDSPNDPFLAGADYEQTRDALVAAGWDVRYDGTADFIDATEESAPLIAYASYGENHDIANRGENPPGSATYIDGFNFVPGALFNTIESYNARAFNGLSTAAGLEQIADFIAAGGTYAVGHVWEPLSFSIPDNAFLLTAMLVRGATFAEAAYSSMPTLSWQHLAVGDPLGRIHLLGDADDDGDIDLADVWVLVDCHAGPFVMTPPLGCGPEAFAQADLDNDGAVTLSDYAIIQELLFPH